MKYTKQKLVTSPDGLTEQERRREYDEKKCNSCGKKYTKGDSGWHVPSFSGYIDIYYYCGDCIEKINKQYMHKNKRLKEIPREIEELQKKKKEVLSPIHEIGNDYYIDWCDVSFGEFKKEVDKYKRNEKKILRKRKHNKRVQDEIDKLNDEKDRCFIGSGLRPQPNT